MKKTRAVVLCLAAGATVLGASPARALTAEQEARLLASDAQEGDEFGSSVAVDGDAAIVGATWDRDNGPASGSAYVFARSAGVWTEQAKLLATDGGFDHRFGCSVALGGDTAAVGATGYDSYSGAVYLFTRQGSVWNQQVKLLPTGGGRGDRFGQSVALDGDAVLVGAPSFRTGSGRGAAFVFTRTGELWTEQAMLVPSDGASSFGWSVALSGNTMVVGARNDSAYVFTASGGTWSEQAKLQASDGLPARGFGESVAVDADTAIVGAPAANPWNPARGSALVFTREGGAWTQQARLQASGGFLHDFFGVSVALSGDTAVIGMNCCPDWDPTAPEEARVFTRAGGVWAEEAALLASDGEPYDLFARSIALDGDTVVVGAINAGLPPAGEAYVFRLLPPDEDGDGVPDDIDLCPDTMIPEAVPTSRLGVNRWALADEDGRFDTALPPGGGADPELEFSVEDTRGCSCEQIIERLNLGRDDTTFGCPTGVMLQWIVIAAGGYDPAQME